MTELTPCVYADKMYCRMVEWEHSAILSTFIKLPFVIKVVFLSVFEWLLRTCGFAVTENPILEASSCTHMHICVHVGTPLAVIVQSKKTNKTIK